MHAGPQAVPHPCVQVHSWQQNCTFSLGRSCHVVPIRAPIHPGICRNGATGGCGTGLYVVCSGSSTEEVTSGLMGEKESAVQSQELSGQKDQRGRLGEMRQERGLEPDPWAFQTLGPVATGSCRGLQAGRDVIGFTVKNHFMWKMDHSGSG